MRLLTLGLDADGRSHVASSSSAEPEPVANAVGVRTKLLHRTTQAPPPPRLSTDVPNIDMGLAPGLVQWMIVEHEPRPADAPATQVTELHTTDTLGYLQVLAGRFDLLLDDGAHDVGVGDCVVTNGVSHALRVGAEGCRMVAVAIGTPPPA